MAAGTAIGVGELRSGREEEGAEEGEEVGREQRVRERREGSLGVSVAPSEEPGIAVEAGAGARAATTRPCSYWQEVDDAVKGRVGPSTVLGRSWAGPAPGPHRLGQVNFPPL